MSEIPVQRLEIGDLLLMLQGILAHAQQHRDAARRQIEHPDQLLTARLGPHLRDTSLLAGLTRRPWPIDAGVEAARRSQGVFDDLVDVALADGRITGRLIRGLVAAAPQFVGRRR